MTLAEENQSPPTATETVPPPKPEKINAFDLGWTLGWTMDRLLTVSEWADMNVILSSKDSSEPGLYRTARTPYVREIADSLSSASPIETVVWIAGAQVGKTRTGLNWIGSVIDVTPGPLLMVQPTVEAARKVSKQRLAPMIEGTPVLAAKVSEPRSRDSANTMFAKEFPGGIVMLTGANSAVGLRSLPIRFLFLDEVDAYPGDVEGEGDPVELARKRTSTFARRKIFMTSTPTIKGLSRIETEFFHSDQRRFYIPCPHCGNLDWMRWENIRWQEHDASTAALWCEACQLLIPERFKTQMLERGEWRTTAPGDGKTAGFHLSALYAPIGWKSWAEIVDDFLKSKGDPSRLKTWVNTVLGETWEEAADSVGPENLKARLEDYGAEVPRGVGVLVASVDVQGDRLECVVKGFGAGEESWLIAFHQIHGDPSKEAVWFELDTFLDAHYTHASGRKCAIRAVLIDSGGLHTEYVYRYAKTRATRNAGGFSQRVFAIKGMAGTGREILGRPSKANRYGVNLFPVGVDTAKDTIFARLRIPAPGPGYIHLSELIADEEYLKQLTAEKAIRKYKRGVGAVREYIKIRERNEALDLEVYALAALHLFGQPYIKKLGEMADALSKPPDEKTAGDTPQTGTRPGGSWVNSWRHER